MGEGKAGDGLRAPWLGPSPFLLHPTASEPQSGRTNIRDANILELRMDLSLTGQWTNTYRPDPRVYIKLIQECQDLDLEGEFSTCFTELQRDFLRQRPTKVKSLIRLVKHWYQLVSSFCLGS